jgi:protein TonB
MERSEAARWLACFAAVVAVHCTFAIAVSARWDNVAPGAPAAVMIELAALPVAPSAQPSEAPPGPEATASESQPMPEQKAHQTETVSPPIEEKAEVEPKVELEPVPKNEAEPEPVKQAELAADISPPLVPVPVQIPELRRAQKPAVAIAVPPPRGEKRKREPKQSEKKPLPEREPRPRSSSSNSAPQAAAAASQRTASIASAGRNASMPDWRNRIVAHLQRNKRFPAGVQAGGTASVRFTIDRNGRVLSSGLSASSGTGALDTEAVAMISRSNPFPPAPADVSGGPFSFSVPVRFNQR